MSEFKFACPVCGQHIKCDSSQGGTDLDCPTCFQKITVPRAPETGTHKFVLSGKKVGERQAAPIPSGASPMRPPRPGFPVAAIALLVLLIGSAVGIFLFRGILFHHGQPHHPSVAPADGTNRPPGQ